MTSRDALLRAAMHRVIARMGHGVADAAAGLAVLVQDAPDRVRQEWDLFQEEVKAEAERLGREGDGRVADAVSSPVSSVEEESLQTKIDQLRARVSALGIRMEERS
ncbi:MAG: hypothetical protein RAK21_11460 [Synechococcus sp. SP2 MAG]|nr:hypothetical protein [Synechococcus sp. SP2 MAG]